MKNIRRKTSAGFTLLELLLVITIIAILAALIFPVLAKAQQRSRQAACTSNLKEISIAFLVFKQDHEDRLPAAVPVNEGGVQEFFFGPGATLLPGWRSNIFRIYQAMSNTLHNPRVVVCPADRWSRAADSFSEMKPSAYWHHPNVSYSALVSFPGHGEGSRVIWGGDAGEDKRNSEYLKSFAGGPDEKGALFLWGNHGYSRGNLLFGDGRVEAWGIERNFDGSRGLQGPIVLATGPFQNAGPSPDAQSSPGTGGASASGDSSNTPEPTGGSSASAQASGNPRRSPASSSSSGTLQKLEDFFGGQPGGRTGPSTARSVSSGANVFASVTTSAPPALSMSSNATPARPAVSVKDAPVVVDSPPLIQPPEPVLETIAAKSPKLLRWLLLLLLLTAAAMAIQRHWQKRRLKEAAGQEGA
jgi:prepilin-type N-terminal cleavage/methylation domain-containing protein